MTTEQKSFINKIGSAAVSLYKTYMILPSLTIAQAILESAWGKSGLSKECNNFFGMKWTSGCGCDYKEYSTREQRSNGSYYTITAKFRKYPSVSAGIEGYYKFLQYPRYRNLKGVTDYEKACDLIKQDGWATSLSYSKNLKNLIKTYNLTEYDERVLGTVSLDEENVAFSRGDYIVTASSIRVRKGAGTKYAQKKFDEMTVNAQKVNKACEPTGLAFYMKGVTFTAQTIVKVSDVEYWAKTPSGYVALMYDGHTYVKKK